MVDEMVFEDIDGDPFEIVIRHNRVCIDMRDDLDTPPYRDLSPGQARGVARALIDFADKLEAADKPGDLGRSVFVTAKPVHFSLYLNVFGIRFEVSL